MTDRISGRIAYRASDGREIGRERFELIGHTGGHVLRAYCEMDELKLTRDVTLAMDAEWRPIDGFCRVDQGGETAALWFDVGDAGVHVTGRIGGERLDSHVRTDGQLAYLGLHPLQGDALIVEARGTDAVGEFRPVAAMTNSISPSGGEALGARTLTIEVAYCGRETITVAAGRFAARRYALRWQAHWPVADLWVREEDCVFLRMDWPLADGWYELSDLE